MADKSYLPGTQAMLVYQDQHGISRSSIVDVVSLDDVTVRDGWRAVKARREVFDQVFNIPTIRAQEIDVEDGFAVSMVSITRLSPVGTRIFRIVQ